MRQNATKVDTRKPRRNGAGVAVPRKRFTRQQQRAAALLADDELTDQQIAAALGVHRATLARWKRQPDFQALLWRLHDAYTTALEEERQQAARSWIDRLGDGSLMRSISRIRRRRSGR